MNAPPLINKTHRAPSLEASGKRRGIFPLRLEGHFSSERRKVAWVLIAVFFVAPWIQFGGRSFLRVDLSNDTLWFLFYVWHQTDAIYFVTIPLLLALTLFLVTALKGRLWCGYACPQTVFLDWLIRPIEEFIEGNAYKRLANSKKSLTTRRFVLKCLKHGIFLVCGVIIGNTFLLYFIEPRNLWTYVTQPPSQHPTEFAFMTFVTLIFYLDFAWFREQFCSFLCPYARFQSILLDESSPVVRYKPERGEPRGKKNCGDCIDCGLCVRVCPAGIDIRDGLQLECIQCFRCVDACNLVMTSLKREPRLIEFSSPQARSRQKSPRVLVYTACYVALLAIVIGGWLHRPAAEITIIRQAKSAISSYSTEGGLQGNVFQARITNTTSNDLSINLIPTTAEVQVVCGLCAKPLQPFESRMASLVIMFPSSFRQEFIELTFKFDQQQKTLKIPIIAKRGGD